MTTPFHFGHLTLSGSTVRLLGIGSKLETDKLVEGLVTAKRLPALRCEQRISLNEARLEAFKQLQALLHKLRDAVKGLRNPPGILGIEENLFEAKDVFFSSNSTTAPHELLGVSAGNRAQPGRFAVVIERVATAHKIAGDATAGANQSLADAFNAGAAFSGSFSLGLVGGPMATVAVDGSMDIYDLRDAINAQASTTGVQASVLRVSSTEYRLLLSATETGRAIALTPTGGDDVLAIVGLTTPGGLKHELQPAQTARLRIDGIAIERPGNVIDDVLPGVTLRLFRADPGTTVTVEVERSAVRPREAILQLVEAYNAFRDFLEVHSRISESGEVAKEAVLFGNGTLRSVASTLGSLLSAKVEGVGAGAFDSLAAIGITLNAINRLQVDSQRLDEALVHRPDAVRRLFEFTFQSSSPDLRVWSRTNALADRQFTVNIVDADGDGRIESATIDGLAADVDGRTIIGRAGTPYEGLVLFYGGHGSTTVDVEVSQGLADRLYNALESMLNAVDGRVTAAIDELGRDNARLRKEIDTIDARVATFRQQLIEKFTALEATLSLTNMLLNQVKAMTASFFGKDP